MELTKHELHVIFSLLVNETMNKGAELEGYTADKPYENSFSAMIDYPKYDPEKYNQLKNEYDALRATTNKIDQALKDAYAK